MCQSQKRRTPLPSPWEGAADSKGAKHERTLSQPKNGLRSPGRPRYRGGSVTAEVVIINRHAIALAADSAVTVGRDKVWTTANKIVSLGPQHDVAVMVFGSGDYLGWEWEAVAKEFRRRCPVDQFKTVADCAQGFREFLLSDVFAREDHQRYSVVFPLYDILSRISKDARKLETPEEKTKLIGDKIAGYRATLAATNVIVTDLDKAAFRAAFEESIMGFAGQSDVLDAAAESMRDEIMELACEFFQSSSESRYASGVVVAGFGEHESFPSIEHFFVDGRWGAHLRWWRESEKCKDLNDPSEDTDFPVITFAQDDVPFLFMAGISFEYLGFLRRSINKIMVSAFSEVIDKFVAKDKQEPAKAASLKVTEEVVASFMTNMFDKVRTDQYLPFNRAVSAMPKEEMALLAEALVDLTALKRKVDSAGPQSVGGDIDVAVISRGDGLIWMKRKHYFDPSKNSDFFVRKSLLEGGTHER